MSAYTLIKIFVHNPWDLLNWHGILWYGRFLYKGSFGMVSFVMRVFGMVSFVLTPIYHGFTGIDFQQAYVDKFPSDKRNKKYICEHVA